MTMVSNWVTSAVFISIDFAFLRSYKEINDVKDNNNSIIYLDHSIVGFVVILLEKDMNLFSDPLLLQQHLFQSLRVLKRLKFEPIEMINIFFLIVNG